MDFIENLEKYADGKVLLEEDNKISYYKKDYFNIIESVKDIEGIKNFIFNNNQMYSFIKFSKIKDGYVIKTNEIKHSNLAYSLKYNKTFFMDNKYQNVDILFFNNDNVVINSNNKYYPLTLKKLSFLCSINPMFKVFIMYWLTEMSQKYPLYKDILRDFKNNSISCNIPVNEIKNYTSYQTLIMGYYKTCKNIPPYVNKLGLQEACEKALFCRNVSINQQQKIYLAKIAMNSYSIKKEILITLYDEILKKELVIKKYGEFVALSYEEKCQFLYDYYEMVTYLKEPINLNIKSIRKLIDAHNKIIPSYMKKVAKNKGKSKMKIPKDSPFRKLHFPNNWELIKTGSRLFAEGACMHHCVYSYRELVNKGKCCIIHIDYNKTPYTAEIKYQKGKYKCVQLYGIYDSFPTDEVIQYVDNIIKDNNK